MLYNPEWNHSKTKQQVMLEAAALIREHGLAKHIRYDGTGYCIHGAVAKVVHGGVYGGDAKEVMRDIVTYMKTQGINPIVSEAYAENRYLPSDDWIAAPWNNRPERTAEEVIAVLEGAAHAV